MPWARIPCDKLITINLFGYELEKEDGKNLWYRGSNGELYCVDRYAPRFWFDSAADAIQAGATAIKISSADESAEIDALQQKLKAIESTKSS